MAKPSKACLDSVKQLTEHHEEDCAVYYSTEEEGTVIVINDPEIAERIVFLLGMFGDEGADEVEEVDGVQVFHPQDPIEA